MLNSFKNGWLILASIHRLFFKHPVLVLPIIFCWLIYAYTIISFRFKFDWAHYSNDQNYLIVFMIILFFSTIISISNLVVLELIQQIESGKPTSIIKSISDSFTQNFIRAFPIILTWAILWFIIAVIEAFTSGKKRSNEKDSNAEELNTKNMAIELANVQEFSFSLLMFNAIKKGFRMMAFTMFPAIAWEDDSTMNAVKKGFVIVKNRWAEFATGFVLTSTLNRLIFFPVSLFLAFAKDEKNIPDQVWTYLLFYIALGWSYSIYLEMLFTAELYLWDMNWRKACKSAESEGRKMPEFHEVKRPSIMDDTNDMKNIIIKNWNTKTPDKE